MLKKLQNKKGFTLVELIVALVILAILAALLVPALTGYIDKAKEQSITAECRMAVMATQTLIDEQYGTVKLADTQKLKADVVISASESTDIADDGTVTVNNCPRPPAHPLWLRCRLTLPLAIRRLPRLLSSSMALMVRLALMTVLRVPIRLLMVRLLLANI